jgi:polysaccharide chain length determinant protein (PEP-CTERM system associated)
MLGHRDLSVDEYMQMLRRRLWWIVVPAVLAPLIAVGVSLRLPNRFTSQTLVLVERQKVPDTYVTPVVSEVLNARLATMQEQILSRTRLQPVIDRFGLFTEVKNASVEEKVELMRKAVSVRPVRGDFGFGGGGGLPGFYISFTASNPRLAQQVCGEITSMFMEENLKLREQSAQGTTDFIKTQLEDAKRNLDEQDAKLAAFKQKYVGQLPGQEQTNFNMLTSLTSQLDAATQALARLHQEKTYTESMLSQQVQTWQTTQSNRSDSTPRLTPDALQQSLSAAQAHVMALQQRYTDTHPDVIKAKKEVASLQKRVDEANAAESAAAQPGSKTKSARESHAGPEPTGIQQLRAQLHGMEISIQDRERAQADLQRQIRVYESRIQLSPVVEEKHKQLTRDYQTALEFYNQLQTKKNQSEMATDLERRQQGEQFRVLDPPNLPEKPTFPNRQLFAAGGFGGGLMLGVIIAFLLEFRDKSIRSEQDVQFYLELPTLALMPTVEIDPAQMRNGNWRKRMRMKSAPREGVGA